MRSTTPARLSRRQRDLLARRGIAGDDTDVIDDLTRFVSERTGRTVVEENRDDENYTASGNLARLREMKSWSQLESPRFQCRRISYAKDCDSRRLREFYIANTCVLLPIYRFER